MALFLLSLAALGLAAIPALLTLKNASLFQPPSKHTQPSSETAKCEVSILIPARDEASGIADCLHAALRSERVNVEVVVLDDASQDATPDIVRAIAQRDSRVRLLSGQPLPAGWNGKQFACFQLSKEAKYESLLFIDADVRLTEDAVWRLETERQTNDCSLLSAFPQQETVTFWEQLMIPMMHYVLLGYLPLDRMRKSTDPAFAAGCGQLFLTSKQAYVAAGTHESIRASRHDGIKLPRLYRHRGLTTDVCDGTSIARCRMYHNAGEVFRGLLKNADEGIANPKLIGPFTVLLFGGSLLPWITLLTGLWQWSNDGSVVVLLISILAIALSFLPRAINAAKYQQPWLGAILHPLVIAVFLVLQWIALFNHITGRKTAWRGRTTS